MALRNAHHRLDREGPDQLSLTAYIELECKLAHAEAAVMQAEALRKLASDFQYKSFR